MTDQGLTDFGAGLRRAREQAGLSLRHIAATTKLSMRTLEALESERVDQLPGGIYRRAIVRGYAAQVGLDPEKTLRTFLDKYPDDVPSMAQLLPPPAPPSVRVRQVVGSLLGAIVPVVAGVVYFSSILGGTAPPSPVTSVIPRAEAVVEETTASAGPSASVPMLITVSSSTNLQVMADGREVVRRPVGAGEIIRVPLGHDVVLLGDNAGAVHFSINGRAGRTLGDSGDPLSAHILRQDYQAWLVKP